MSQDYFDILGVGSREDSYTDLIVNSFRKNFNFRKKLIKNLGLSNQGKWEIVARKTYHIRKKWQKKSQRMCPDITIYNRDTSEIVIIENKIFASETNSQTQDYALDEFQKQVAQDLDLMSPNYFYFYLTLDGSSPSSDVYKEITYGKEILNSIPSKGSDKIFFLLDEFRNRIQQYNKWSGPTKNSVVISYLINTAGFVSSTKVFNLACDEFLDNTGLTIKFSQTGRSSTVPIAILQKDSWIGSDTYDDTGTFTGTGAKCYSIHFELQWKPDSQKLVLYLHYEPYPYRTQRQITRLQRRSEGVKFFNSYQKTREAYVKKVEYKLPGLDMKRNSLTVASRQLDPNQSFSTLQKQITDIVKKCTPVIDDAIR